MKIVSFIIPAYNSEAYLDKCIGSMLVPEILDRLEIIIVNDGSTDTTQEIANRYCAKYPDTVRLISQENKGHGGALNAGCAVAQGKYLKVIDADDWVETQNLPEFLWFLEQSDSDVVLTHYHTIDIGTGEIQNWRSYPEEFGKTYSFAEVMANWPCFERSLYFHGITYRTAFYRKYGTALPEHVFYEDHEFATFPCCRAEGVQPLDLFVYDYRIGDVNQSVSDGNQLKRIGHTETVIRRMIAQYRTLPENDGKRFAARKTHGLVLSYLTTVLLVNPDRKAGRNQAKHMLAQCRSEAPEVYAMVKRKYLVFYMMNRLHVDKQVWASILNGALYKHLRCKRSFE